MNSRAAVAIGLTAAFLLAQSRATLRNTNNWPFTGYNMFNYTLPETYQQLRVVLYRGDGESLGPTDTWGLIPLEFFRVISVLQGLFMRPLRTDKRNAFWQDALTRMNQRPWSDFDERRASLRFSDGGDIVAAQLFLVSVCRRCDAQSRAAVHQVRLLHQYDPLDVVAGEVRWSSACGQDHN